MTTRTYRGVTIDRVPHNGMYYALVIGKGRVMADTLAGIKHLIRHTQEAS